MTFSWKRGFKHALIPLALVIVAGAVIAATRHVANPEKFGEGVGRFAAVCLVAGLGISALIQKGKQGAAWACGLALGGLIVGGTVYLVLAERPARTHAVVDRSPLVEDGLRLRHPSLGFSIRRPPASFKLSPEVAATMGGMDPDVVTYAYAEEPPSMVLAVSVMYGMDAGDLAEAIKGIKSGLSKGGPVTWIRDDLGKTEAHIHGVVSGAHVQVAAYQLPTAIVTVMVVAREADALADVLASFQR